MKKKNLILKAVIAMLAFGGLGAVSNFMGLNLTSAMMCYSGMNGLRKYSYKIREEDFKKRYRF